MMTVLSNARSVMKIDIVKPMPPKNPAPVILFQFKPSGNELIPTATAMNEKRQMPNGFPINRPAIIPRLYF